MEKDGAAVAIVLLPVRLDRPLFRLLPPGGGRGRGLLQGAGQGGGAAAAPQLHRVPGKSGGELLRGKSEVGEGENSISWERPSTSHAQWEGTETHELESHFANNRFDLKREDVRLFLIPL